MAQAIALVTWQTAYSALIEGDYSKCKGITPTCGSETETPTAVPLTTTSTVIEVTTTTFSSGITTEESSSCLGTICGKSTSEPISKEVRNQRDTASCTLDNASVEAIAPLRASTSEILNLASIAAYSSDVIDYSN